MEDLALITTPTIAKITAPNSKYQLVLNTGHFITVPNDVISVQVPSSMVVVAKIIKVVSNETIPPISVTSTYDFFIFILQLTVPITKNSSATIENIWTGIIPDIVDIPLLLQLV